MQHKTLALVAGAFLIACTIALPAKAEAQKARPAPPPAPASATNPTMSRPQRTNSIIALLLLDGAQIDRLDRAYDDYARTRLEREADIARLSEDLKRVQAPTAPPDEKRAARLVRDMGEAQQKILDAFVRARSEALRALTPEQRAQLEVIQAENKLVTDDKYRQLLLLPLDALLQVRVDLDTVNRLLAARRGRRSDDPRFRASVGYGSYGHGFGYGGFGYDYWRLRHRHFQHQQPRPNPQQRPPLGSSSGPARLGGGRR